MSGSGLTRREICIWTCLYLAVTGFVVVVSIELWSKL